jgi:sugar lactone lactonase YvrE
MKMTFLVVAAAVAQLIGVPAAAAADVHHPSTAFDFSAGENPEDLSFNPDGSMNVSMLGQVAQQPPSLVRLHRSGAVTTLVRGENGEMLTGHVRADDGTIYYNLNSPTAARAGVWKLPPAGQPVRVAAVPGAAFFNGLALHPHGRTLYVADSIAGVIWAVDVRQGTSRAWLENPILAPTATDRFGANGVRYHRGGLWISSTAHGALVKVPITGTGQPGPMTVVTSGGAGIDDFTFAGDHSDVVIAAANRSNEVQLIRPDGRRTTILDHDDGLNWPTAVELRGSTLYVTQSGLHEPHDARIWRIPVQEL